MLWHTGLVITKRAADVKDWTLDFTDFLETGETIADATAVASTGLTVTATNIVATDTGVQIWLSGGTAGETYTITVTVTTDASPIARVEERILTMDIA